MFSCYTCMNTHLWGHMYTHLHVCACGSQKLTSLGAFPNYSPQYLLKQGSKDLSNLPSLLWESQSLWLMNSEMTNGCHTCYVGSGAPESDPHTCTQSALSTVSSFQPNRRFQWLIIVQFLSYFEHEVAKWPWQLQNPFKQAFLIFFHPNWLLNLMRNEV